MNQRPTVAERLAAVRESIAEAARRGGRDPAEVTLIAVSKRIDSELVQEALEAGQRDFGENYLQHALVKMKALAGSAARWHMIGKLQSNKAAKAARSFSLIHGLDSMSAARAISKAMVADSGTARVLVQIKLGGGAVRAGVAREEAAAFAREVSALAGIEICGVMGVSPVDEEPRLHFARLRETGEELRGLGLPNAPCTEISAGMTQDYAEAILEGATMVRVGTAVFGPRDEA